MSDAFLPVDASSLSLSSLPTFVDLRGAALDADALAAVPPTSLADLPNADTFTSVLSLDVALTLGIPVYGSVGAKYSRRVYIQEFLRFVDDETSDPKKRYGVGVRWVVNVRLLDAEAKTASIPFISASAQVGQVEASARFQVIGLNSDAINDAIPVPADLNVETYAQMQAGFAEIKGLIDDPATQVTPQLLAIFATVKDTSDQAYEAAMATGWALSKIEDGRSLTQAKNDYPHGSVPFDETVKSVYIDVAETSDPLAKPSAQARARARDLMLGLRVRK